MRREFKVDIKHQLMSARECFSILLLYLLAAVAFVWWEDAEDPFLYFRFAFIIWLLTAFLMIVPFHIQYLIWNWNQTVWVDFDDTSLQIENRSGQHFLRFSDIHVTRHLLGHYKPGRTKSWTPIPFDYYGYLEVRSKGGQKFILTSLMINPFDPPIPVDETVYRFTFIKGKK